LGTFAWPLNLGPFPDESVRRGAFVLDLRLVTFVSELSLGSVRSFGKCWVVSVALVGILRLGIFYLIFFDCKVSFRRNFRAGAFAQGLVCWDCSFGGFCIGTFVWCLTLGIFRLGTFDWDLRGVNFHLGACAWGLRLETLLSGTFGLGFSFGIFVWKFGWELSLGHFRLGTLGREPSLGIFRLGALAWERSRGNFRLGTCVYELRLGTCARKDYWSNTGKRHKRAQKKVPDCCFKFGRI
jgi:hypothetical protein